MPEVKLEGFETDARDCSIDQADLMIQLKLSGNPRRLATLQMNLIEDIAALIKSKY